MIKITNQKYLVLYGSYQNYKGALECYIHLSWLFARWILYNY